MNKDIYKPSGCGFFKLSDGLPICTLMQTPCLVDKGERCNSEIWDNKFAQFVHGLKEAQNED